MVGYKKLALIAAGLLAGLAVEAQAAPFTEGVFVTYNSSRDSGSRWRHGAGFLIHFVSWREENPQPTVMNISWVHHWAGDGGAILKSDGTPLTKAGLDPQHPYLQDTVPTWRSNAFIPEPSTALLVGAGMALASLRRKNNAV